MVKTVKVKVTKNVWGNYRGHVTGMGRTVGLGANDFEAKQWASNMLDMSDGGVMSPLSYFTMADIEAHRAYCAKPIPRTLMAAGSDSDAFEALMVEPDTGVWDVVMFDGMKRVTMRCKDHGAARRITYAINSGAVSLTVGELK